MKKIKTERLVLLLPVKFKELLKLTALKQKVTMTKYVIKLLLPKLMKEAAKAIPKSK